MKKYLITGCNGQLGRALNEVLANDDQVTLVNTDVEDLNICDLEAVRTFVGREKPDVIINCAAHTAVDLCEEDKENAYNINAVGPKNLAMAAEENGAEIVQVSTDYVFDGEKETPYVESDAVGPQSVYGSTKLQGEQEVQKASSRFYIVRTAWLYGDGKNFVRTMLNLAKEHDHLTVVNDQFGSPTTAIELARAILVILEKGDYGIYHATCEGVTSWYEFACRIFKEAGISVEVAPVSSEEYKSAAKRPKYSVLEDVELKKLGYVMKDWEDALKEYLIKEQICSE